MKARIVVVMPAYNAEKTLSKVARGLRQSVPDGFLVGVDDGSADGTAALLRSVCDRAIRFNENRGKGAALRAGYEAAFAHGFDALLTIDSDGQHDPAFAPSILAALSQYHIAIGTRDLQGEQMPRHRRLANFLSTAATRFISGGAVGDSQSGFRAIRREVLDEVHGVGDRYEYETDFIIRAARAGFTITNVPISTIYGPPSYFRAFRDALLVIRVLLRHVSGSFRKYKPRDVTPLLELM